MTRAVDLFAGWGGFTEGAERVPGVEVLWAANHWPLAVEAHALNHPGTAHSCQDLQQADWTQLPDYELLLASPACQGHSTASQPKRRHYHDALRATAWAVVECAEVTRPETVIVENVPPFASWIFFNNWLNCFELMGYKVSTGLYNCARFGVPQRRRRLVVCASRVGAELPVEPTVPEAAFGSHIQWDAGTWRPIGNASSNVQQRIGDAQDRHGAKCLSQHVTGHKGVGLDEPIRTITKQDQWVVVNDDSYRPLTIREVARAMSFPDTYGWPTGATRSDTIAGLGNAIPPLFAEALIKEVA